MVRPSFAMNTASGAYKLIIALILPELNRSSSVATMDSDIRDLLLVLVGNGGPGRYSMKTVDLTEGRTARPPRVLTDEHRQHLDPRRRRLQPAVRLSNPKRVATGSSGAFKTDVVRKTAAARTQ